jgi:hypothetical protein
MSPPADAAGRRFGHAAFDPADVEDARRGRPAQGLESFAAWSGLERRHAEVAGAFLSTQPDWPDYVFDLCRGALPTGRLGMIAHELYEVPAHDGSISAGGAFYDVRVTTRGSLRELTGLGVREPKNEPFAANAVWIPTTTVHVRAPETNRLPLLRLTRSNGPALFGGGDLAAHGLPGFRAVRGTEDAERLATAVGAAGPWLRTRPDTYLELRVRYGLVALTVNGYRHDHTDLAHLLTTADGIAQALAVITPAPWDRPLAEPGPPVGSVRFPPGIPLPHPLLVPQYAELARQWGLHQEDPAHLLGLLPRCPIPGIVSGVLAGTLPGTSTVGRLVWFEQGGRTSGSVRGGLILEAVPGAVTPLGGHLDPSSGVYVEVVDGVAFAWRQQRSFGVLEPEVLLASTLTALRTSGLTAIR